MSTLHRTIDLAEDPIAALRESGYAQRVASERDAQEVTR